MHLDSPLDSLDKGKLMLSQRKVLALVMLSGLIVISPMLVVLGVRGIFVSLASVAVLIVVYRGGDMQFRSWFIGIALVVFVLSFAPAFYWTDIRYILSTVFLVFSLFLVQLADQRAVDIFLTYSTRLMLVLLVGAIIGFILVFNGLKPLFEIANNDGRPNYFFYTTFSNSWWGRVVRPSGIYDEPGAFSFMVCGIAALRHLRGRDSRVTWLMLGMGFVTLSLAHLIYVSFHVMAERLKFRNLVGIAAILLPLVVIAGFLGAGEIMESRLLKRMTITDAGELAGDNRSYRMVNAIVHLNDHPKSLLFGADPSCRFDSTVCSKKFPLMGENPVAPLAYQGILLSWPYYFALVVLLFAPLFGRKYLVSFAFGALLLQRPYLLGLGYALIGSLVVVATLEGMNPGRYGRRAIPDPGKRQASIGSPG